MNPWQTPLAFVVGMIVGFTMALLLRRMGWDRADALRTILGVLILGLVGYTALTSAVANSRVADIASCQARANDSYYASRVEVSEAAAAETRAQREFLLAPIGTPDNYIAARDLYLQALDRLEAARVANPPQPPELCERQP